MNVWIGLACIAFAIVAGAAVLFCAKVGRDFDDDKEGSR